MLRIWFLQIFTRPKKTHVPRTGLFKSLPLLNSTGLITLVGISWWWYFYVPIFDWGPPFCSPFVNPPTATWMDAPSFPTTHILRHFRKRRRCVRTLIYRSMVIFGSTNRDGTLANSHSPVRDFLICKINKQLDLTQPLHTNSHLNCNHFSRKV